MTDETTIRPALTPEEWRSLAPMACVESYAADYVLVKTWGDDARPVSVGEMCSPVDVSRHALAALALHGQPFGFTWADVDELLSIADGSDKDEESVDDYYGGQFVRIHDAPLLRSLATRLAALLPPRDDARWDAIAARVWPEPKAP